MSSYGVDIKELFEAGAHFGHKTSRWHPKMAQFIHSKSAGNHIIDLSKTVTQLEEALSIIEKTISEGKQILLVGTKRQAQDAVNKLAEETRMPYVTNRWLGGMLTNFNTMNERIKHLKDLESKMESGQLAAKYSKLEVQRFQEEIEAMNELYGGIKEMAAKPGVVFVFDINHNINAVKEARKLGIKVIAIADTNTDPSLADLPIPANDDAIKTVQLIAKYLQLAIMAGKAKQKIEPKEELVKDKKVHSEKEKVEKVII